jgi:hypothetical protein
MMRRVLLILAATACGGDDQPAGEPDGAARPDAAFLAPRPSPIAAENELPGSDDWEVGTESDGLWAWADRASYLPGERVIVRAAREGAAATGTWQLWRMGWYGGTGGRLVAEGGPVTFQAADAAGVLDPATGTVRAPWAESFTVDLPADAVTGVYLVKVATADRESYALVVVREPAPGAPILYPVAVNTYQAYNPWGGTSLYESTRPEWTLRQAYAVSFDRPYDNGKGSGEFLPLDFPFVRWAESRGYDVAYVTDADLDANPALVDGRRMLAIQGHNEYWTRAMRGAVEGALEAGTNVAFLGANICYWQARYDGPGRRTLVGYKRYADDDPAWDTDPSLVTVRWREEPLGRPENAFIGIQFGDVVWPSYGALIVTNPDAWVWAGTGVRAGDVIPGVYGIEIDRRDQNGREPPAVEVFGTGMVANSEGESSLAESAFHTAASGAQVFAAGSITWSLALGDPEHQDERIQIATANVFARFTGQDATPRAVPATASGVSWRRGVSVSTLTDALTAPLAVAAAAGGDVVVLDAGWLVRVDGETGATSLVGGPFEAARALAVAPDGAMVVVDGDAIREVVAGGPVTTVAQDLAHPDAVTVLADGTIVVAERAAHRVTALSPRGGPETWAELTEPIALAALPDGGVAVVESAGGAIRRIDPVTRAVTTLHGYAEPGASGWRDGAQPGLAGVVAIAARGEEIVFVDAAAWRLRVAGATGVDTIAGGRTSRLIDGLGSEAGFNFPRSVAIASDGSILVVDAGHHAVRKVLM